MAKIIIEKDNGETEVYEGLTDYVVLGQDSDGVVISGFSDTVFLSYAATRLTHNVYRRLDEEPSE